MPTIKNIASFSAQTAQYGMSLTYESLLPAPIFAQASPAPVTYNGIAVSLGTVAPGVPGNTLTVSLINDVLVPTGSTISLSGSSVMYTPTDIQPPFNVITYDSVIIQVNDITSGTSYTTEAQVGLLYASPGAPTSGTFTPAGSPSTSGSPVVIGSIGGGGNGVLLAFDAAFPTGGSSISLSGSDVVYTPGTITPSNTGLDVFYILVLTGTRFTTALASVTLT